ncbi:MAG: hypothetical protein F4150_09130, partial [Chloroflexi bacterium]|nr:hypothetical protein [Chloroflexota bacterium]
GPPERATTDADGLARFPIAAASGPDRVSYPDYLVRIVEGGRTGVAVTWWDGDRSLHAPGVPVSESLPELHGHLYTDRPIYRPGETVHYGGVVRAEDDAAYSLPGPGRALSLEVRGPSHAPPDVTAQADELGAFAGELVLPADAAPGTYRIRIPGGRRGQIAATTFTVAEFRVPEFAVEAEASRTDVVAGEQIPVEARARFYFGPPVADAAVSWAALASPTRFLAEGYEGYSFSRYDRGEGRPLRASGTAQTDGSGLARFHAPAALEPGEGTHRFTISATVTDRNAQAVASSTEVTVHPATWYAGIRTDSYVAAAGRPQAIHLVSVDTGGRAAPHRPITVRILARDYREGVPHDTEIGVLSATTDERGEASVAYTPLATGEYRLVAESVDGQGRVARAERYLWVSGRDHASWRPRDDNLIELVADRDRYEVGDVAEVLVPAPFAGATGLVTIERGRVLESEVRRFETNSEVLHIPIDAGHVPNVYVGVLLYLPPRGENPRPEFRVGYVNLPVSTAAVELDVRVEPERDRAAPGETVRYEVEVTDSEGRGTEAEVSVAIVDEAVLALAADLGPDGLGAFWYERALGVRTASSLAPRSRDAPRHDDGLYDGDAMDDAGPPEGDRHPPPAGAAPGPHLRSDFRHTALWIGRLSTGPDGKASFELALPDNATTWRARARAVGPGTRVGEGESELLVSQPLLVRPALPRFLRVGDELMLRTLVHNRTAEVRDVTVAIEAEGVVLDRDAALTRRVEPGRSALFAWPARALDEGTATVRFLATASGGAADAAELLIPVHLDVTPETVATGGVVEETPAVEALYLPDYAITDRGSLELSVEASLIGALDAELHHFSPSDGESIVEIASRIVATVAVERAGAGALTEARATQLETDIETLVGLQRGGGWAWCRGCTRTDMWVTGWVLFALGEARGAGYAIPRYVYDRAGGLITGFVERETDIERPGNPDQHAFLLYALASVAAGGSDAAAVAGEQAPLLQGLLDEHRASLTSWGRAYLLLGLLAGGHEAGHEAVRILINDLSAAAIASANGNHWEDERIAGSMHNGSVRATALVLRALAGVDPGHPLIDETIRWLVTARSGGRWGTSVERAEGMASLSAVAALTGETRGAYDYRVLLNTRLLLSGRFDVPQRDYAEAVAVPLDELPPGEVSRVHLEREAGGEGRMYYGLNLRYVTPSRHIGALNRGFAVSHRYTLLDDPGRVITSASPGDIVRVTVTVVASADRLFARVEDFLPAGLEPIDPELAVVSARVRQQLDEDQRQARLAGAPSDFAPWYRWYYSPWDQVHLRDDRVVLLADRLPRGVHEYVYYARATTPGDFFVAPARAQEAYFPEVFGRSDSSRFSVVADE